MPAKEVKEGMEYKKLKERISAATAAKEIEDCLKLASAELLRTKTTTGLCGLLQAAVEAFSNQSDRPNQFMESFIAIHKKLLTEHNILECIDISEILLDKTKGIKCAGLEKHRYMLYCYLWSYMRANHNALALEQNIALIRTSLGFSLTIAVEHFNDMAQKMEQCFVLYPKGSNKFIPRADRDDLQLTVNILMSCTKSVIIRDNTGRSTSSFQGLNFYSGYFSFMLASLATLLQVRAFDKAETCITDMIQLWETQCTPTNTILTQLARSAGETVVRVTQILYGAVDNENEFISNLNDFMSTQLNPERHKTNKGYLYFILQAFLRTMNNIITFNHPLGASPTTRQPISNKVFDTIINSFITLLKMEKSSKDVPKGATTATRGQFQVEVYTSLLSLVADRVGFGIEYKFLQSLTDKIMQSISHCDQARAQTALGFAIGKICAAYHQNKEFEAVVPYSQPMLTSIPDWNTLTPSDKSRVMYILMLVADAYYELKMNEDCLKYLVKILHECPDFIGKNAPAFDSFTPLSVQDWSCAWLRAKKEIGEESPCKNMTTIELTSKKFSTPVAVLRMELNSYFCGKHVPLDEIITAGETLEDNSIHFADKALGVLAQGIGFWWGDEEQEIDALLLTKNALGILDSGLENDEKNAPHNPIVDLVYALSCIWNGMCLQKVNMKKANKDLESARLIDMQVFPEKYKGVEMKKRVIPAISSLTIQDEEKIADVLVRAVELLYCIIQFGELNVMPWLNHVGPAIICISARFLAHWMSILGDTCSAIKSWHIVFVLGKWYNLRRLMILSGTELLRRIPNLDSSVSDKLDEICGFVRKNWPGHKLATSFILRVDLAKSIACYNKKDYKKGLQHLKKVIDYRLPKEKVDTIGHLNAEAYFLLAKYRILEESNLLKINLGLAHQYLVEMSPSFIATKACKYLNRLTRKANVRCGGWQDLSHNYHILQTIVENHPFTMDLIAKVGKHRDARFFSCDYVYLTQQLGLISRSMEIIVPLIEIELRTRSVDQALCKINCVLKMINSLKTDPMEEKGESMPEDGSKTGYEWDLPDVKLPEYHYGLCRKEQREEEISLTLQKIVVPYYLRHGQTCSCYLCRHSIFGPLTIRFLHVQALYASLAKRPSTSLCLMKLAKHYLLRNISRSTATSEKMTEAFKPIMNKQNFQSTMELTYMPQHYATCSHWGLSLMEITPTHDIELTIQLYRFLTKGIKLFNPQDMIAPLYPLEAVMSAIFAYMYNNQLITIPGAELRETFRAYAEKCEMVKMEKSIEIIDIADDSTDHEIVPETPPDQQAPNTPVIVCPTVPKKGRRTKK